MASDTVKESIVANDTDEGNASHGTDDAVNRGLVNEETPVPPLIVYAPSPPSINVISAPSRIASTNGSQKEEEVNNVTTTDISPIRLERHPSDWRDSEVSGWFRSHKLDKLYEALFNLPEPINGATLARIFESKFKNYEQYKAQYTRRLPSDQTDLLKEFDRFGQLLDTYFIDKYSHRFDVAFSFPGEQRKLVEKIATKLCAKIDQNHGEQRIFYDRFHKVELARPNLDVYLQAIYRYQARLIVVFMCDDYSRKEWCGLESRAIRGLLKTHQSDRIMLLTVDGCVIDGITEIDGYWDISKETIDDVVDAIHKRLRALGEPLSPFQSLFPSPSLTLVSTPSLLKRTIIKQLTDWQFNLLSALPWFIVVGLLSYILGVSAGR